MPGKLNRFQSQEFTGWMGLTKDNHLSSVFLQEPQKATDLLVQLHAYHKGNTLVSLLSKFPKKEFEDDSEYTWDVIGSAKRNIPLVKAEDFSGTTITSASGNVGANMVPFYLYFAEDWFAKGEVIFGNLNQVYPIRVLDSAVMVGTMAKYKCEVMGGLVNGVPAERLLAGERFSVGFAPVSKELSRKAGDIRFTTPVAMRNEWTTIRLQHKVPGNKLDKKIAFGIPLTKEINGKVTKTTDNKWMHYVDWVFEDQWQDYKNMAVAWGSSNRNANGEYLNYDPSGEVIRMGDGLFAQMERGNVMYYNTFSLKLIEDALYQLSAAKLDMNNRVFVLRTGERGAALFNKAVGEEVSGWLRFTLNGDAVGVVKKVDSPLHQNALSAGYQFVEYHAPNGVVLKLEIDPFYDDPVHNKQLHPLGGPASSYRFDILDLGHSDEPNIFLCGIKGQSEIRGYEPGLRNPFTGEQNIHYMSNDEDATTVHRMTTLGVCVLDPTRTMSIVPSILQG